MTLPSESCPSSLSNVLGQIFEIPIISRAWPCFSFTVSLQPAVMPTPRRLLLLFQRLFFFCFWHKFID